MVGGLGGDVGLGLGVDGSALVGDLSDVAVDVVSSVLHGLDPAVGKGNLVRSRDDTVGIASLSGVEVGLGVVIGNTVGVGVRLRGLLDVDNRSRGIGRGSVDNRGSMIRRSRGMVYHRGGMVCRSRGMMYHWSWAIGWSSMVDSMRHRMVNSMSNRMVHCVWHRVVDGMGYRVGDVVGNWMTNETMVSNRVRQVGNLLDEGAGRSCRQQRGEDESLENRLSVTCHSPRKTEIPDWVFKSLHIHTISTFILFCQEVL